MDHKDPNIIVTPEQREKVNNRRRPNMFTMKKDRKATRMSLQNWLSKSPCLREDILESKRNHSGYVTKKLINMKFISSR